MAKNIKKTVASKASKVAGKVKPGAKAAKKVAKAVKARAPRDLSRLQVGADNVNRAAKIVSFTLPSREGTKFYNKMKLLRKGMTVEQAIEKTGLTMFDFSCHTAPDRRNIVLSK